MPSSARPTLLLLVRDCLLLLPTLATPPLLVVPRGLCRCSPSPPPPVTAAAKAAKELLPPLFCRGDALRLRWWPGRLLTDMGLRPLGAGLLGGWGVKPGPVPSG